MPPKVRHATFAVLLAGAAALKLPPKPEPGVGRRAAVTALAFAAPLSVSSAFDSRRITAAAAEDPSKPKFRRLSPIQFIAALGDPQASSGTGAEKWGLWREEAFGRGVWRLTRNLLNA